MYKLIQIFQRWGIIPGTKVIWQFVTKLFNKNAKIGLADENYQLTQIEKRGYIIRSDKQFWKIQKDKLRINCRKSTSDVAVFCQIFIYDEFDKLVQLIKEQEFWVNTIIDAGSNIGMSAVRLGKLYTPAVMICIEPDSGNYNLLKQNLSLNNINAIPLNTGIWNKTCRLYFDRSFRDGKEWAISLTEEPISDNYVASVSINDIVAKNNIQRIDLLKIDIEGGERYIFNQEQKGLEFLDITQILAIEIHEEFHIKATILDILNKKKFNLSQSGEYLIAYK